MLNYYSRYVKVMVKRSLHNVHIPHPDAFQLAEGFIVLWTLGCAAHIAMLGH